MGMGVVCVFVLRVWIFFVHLLDCKWDLVRYFVTAIESGFDALLCFDLVVLGVDEGLALVTVDGVFVDFFFSGDVMDGCIAADNGQIFPESCSALIGAFNQILNPLLFFIWLPINVFIQKALCCQCLQEWFQFKRYWAVAFGLNQEIFS